MEGEQGWLRDDGRNAGPELALSSPQGQAQGQEVFLS